MTKNRSVVTGVRRTDWKRAGGNLLESWKCFVSLLRRCLPLSSNFTSVHFIVCWLPSINFISNKNYNNNKSNLKVFPDFLRSSTENHEFQKCLTQQLLLCNGSRGSRKTCFEGQPTCACINSAMFDYKNHSHITLQLHPMGSFHFWYIDCIYHHVSTTSISGPGTVTEHLLSLSWS